MARRACRIGGASEPRIPSPEPPPSPGGLSAGFGAASLAPCP
jgi:hypothetical protein